MRPLGVFARIDAGLGVHLDVLRELAVPTIHLHTSHSESRTESNAASFRTKLADLGVKISVVFAGFEGESYADIPTTQRTVGLAPAAARDSRLAELKEIADFARLLSSDATSHAGGPIPVGLHVGFVPHDPAEPEYGAVVAATQAICDRCDAHGQAVRFETGQEPADVLLRFLGDCGRGNLTINFDPANMILYGCGEPLPALKRLGAHLRSVHARTLSGATSRVKPGARRPRSARAIPISRHFSRRSTRLATTGRSRSSVRSRRSRSGRRPRSGPRSACSFRFQLSPRSLTKG